MVKLLHHCRKIDLVAKAAEAEDIVVQTKKEEHIKKALAVRCLLKSCCCDVGCIDDDDDDVLTTPFCNTIQNTNAIINSYIINRYINRDW